MTKLERENPDIADMVKQLDGRVIYRPGKPGYYRLILGGSDWQLTGYVYNKDDSLMSEADNIEAAKIKLRRAIERRTTWGTLRERGERILEGVRELAKAYRPQCYNNFFDIGGDAGTCFASYYPRTAMECGITKAEWDKGRDKDLACTAWIELIGIKQVKFEGGDFDVVLKKASEWVRGLENS